jgi:hypothetical protein
MKKLVFLLVFSIGFALSTMAVASDIAFYVGTPNPGWYDPAPMMEHVDTIIAKTGHLFGDVQKFDDTQLADLGAWTDKRTNDGVMDIIWLNGCTPSCLYPTGNAQPDGSRIEAWLDGGNMIINVGDWFGYISYETGARSSPENGPTGAANILDLSSSIIINAGQGQMVVTETGQQYLPSLNSVSSERPVLLSAVVDPWEVSAVFAQNAAGTYADPVVIHNKDTGGYVAIINQATTANWVTDRGQTCAEFIGNWVADVIGLGDRSLAGVLNPAKEAVDVLRDAILGWTPGQYAQTHDVYFGTVFDDVNNASRTDTKGVLASQDQTAATFDPVGLLAFGQTYY